LSEFAGEPTGSPANSLATAQWKVKMFKVIRLLQNSSGEHKIVWKAVVALSLGVLLGTLVAVPYDQAFSFSVLPYPSYLYTALQSLAAMGTLVSVRTTDKTELVVEIESLP
jgi:hypothetical protein